MIDRSIEQHHNTENQASDENDALDNHTHGQTTDNAADSDCNVGDTNAAASVDDNHSGLDEEEQQSAEDQENQDGVQKKISKEQMKEQMKLVKEQKKMAKMKSSVEEIALRAVSNFLTWYAATRA